jgi:hypothetical protein
LAATAGFLTYRNWKGTYLKWFPYYLSIIALLAISYYILKSFHKLEMAKSVISFAVPIEILFINYFFYKTLTTKNKKIIIWGTVLFTLTWIIENTIFSNQKFYLQSLSYTTANLFILVYIILFFIEFAHSNKILSYKKSVVFWIVLGMLLFYVGTFPFYGLYNELAKNLDIFYPVAWVATSLNYSMYLLFTIGFIWGKPH